MVKKGYRCFDPITQKLYVSRHVVFLEHIPFFSISSTTYSLTKTDLIHIDPFYEDSGNDTSPHVRSICTHNSASTGILLSSTPEAPFSSTTPQASSEIVDPFAFVSPQNYHILLILVILHLLLPF